METGRREIVRLLNGTPVDLAKVEAAVRGRRDLLAASREQLPLGDLEPDEQRTPRPAEDWESEDGAHLHAGEPTFDPTGLSRPQRRGAACVVCDKRWPRPATRVGRFPGGDGAYACPECARMLVAALRQESGIPDH